MKKPFEPVTKMKKQKLSHSKQTNPLIAVLTVSGLTLLSRISGMLRETLFAASFGAGAMTDAFLASFRLPNLFRRLFAEGAFSQAFLPILVQQKEKVNEMAAKKLIHHTVTVLFWILFWFSLLGVLLAPFLLYGIASGLAARPEVFQEGVWMTRMMFPYILFMSMVAFSGAALNAWGHFKVPAFTPVLLNLTFIAGVLISVYYFDSSLRVLSVAVFIAGIFQVIFQIPVLRKLGIFPHLMRFGRAIKNLGVRQILKNMLPGLFGVSIAQISLIINTQIASHLKPGSMTWLSYADRLMELPTALIGVALSTVLLPYLSKVSTSDSPDQQARFHALMEWGLRFALVLVIPCSLILFLLTEPVVAVLFHYGRFSQEDLLMTSSALRAYGLGLMGLILVKVFAPACYARKDVKTPVIVGVGVLILTQILNTVLVPWIGVAGLALSISIGAICNAGLLFFILWRKKRIVLSRLFYRQMVSVLIALVVAIAASYPFTGIDWAQWKNTPLLRVAVVSAILLGVMGVYLFVLYLRGFRIKDFRFQGKV
jgi:putative peptidoglycan lipid II flippase